MADIIVSQTGTTQVGSRYVGTTGATIQTALDYMLDQGGGTLFVERGTYIVSTPIFMYSHQEIFGEGIKTHLKPSFSNSGVDAVIAVVGTLAAPKVNVYIHDLVLGGDASIRIGRNGLYVNYVGRNTSTGLANGVGRHDVSGLGVSKQVEFGVRVENCIIRHNNYMGIRLENSNNCVFENNTIMYNGDEGVYVINNSNSFRFAYNHFQNNVLTGMLLSNLRGSSIYGNVFQNNGTHGLSIGFCDQHTVTGNNFLNNLNTGIYTNGTRNSTISGNIVSNNGVDGIMLNASRYTGVNGNTIQNNGFYGIAIYGSSSNTVTGNTIHSNGTYAIAMTNASTSNTIGGNSSDFHSGIDYYIVNSPSNIASGNKGGVYLSGSSGTMAYPNS